MSNQPNPYEPYPSKTIRDWVLGIGEFSEENLRKSREETAKRMVATVMEAMEKQLDAALGNPISAKEYGENVRFFLQHTNLDAVPEATADSRPLGNPVASAVTGTGDTQEAEYWLIRDKMGMPFEVCYLPKGHKRILAPGYSKVPLYEKPQPTLADEEREALEWATITAKHSVGQANRYDTLRSLLERMK